MNPDSFHFSFIHHCPSIYRRIFLASFGHWMILHVYVPCEIPAPTLLCAARSPPDTPSLQL